MQIDKKDFRRRLIISRDSIDIKIRELYDKEIFDKVVATKQFNECNTLLCYVSYKSEVDTKKLINFALQCGKKVAVPKCEAVGNKMNFYYINSLNDLELGYYNILEPIVGKSTLCNDFDNSVCIVPGLGFDSLGYRIGYGKGYYDRFLKNYNGYSIGIGYSINYFTKLVSEDFDIAVNSVITEK